MNKLARREERRQSAQPGGPPIEAADPDDELLDNENESEVNSEVNI